MTKKISLSLLMAAMFLTSSCAGLISGKTQNVFLRASDGSDDLEVEVMSSHGTQSAKLPASIMVARDKMPLTITVKEDKCHKESKTYVPSKYNIMLLTDALGGVLGLTGTSIDMSSGAAWAYEDNVFVETRKKSSCK